MILKRLARIMPFLIVVIYITSCNTVKIEAYKPVSRACNAIIIRMGANPDLNFSFTGNAHAAGLKIYALVEISDSEADNNRSSLPELKTSMKIKVRNLVSVYDIDGILVKSNEYSHDIIEDILAEAMLIKPYLVNSLLYTGEDGQKFAKECLDAGIIDFITPETSIQKSGKEIYPDSLIIQAVKKRIAQGQVVGLDFSGIFAGNQESQRVSLGPGKGSRITDTEGKIGFVMPVPDTLKFYTESGNVNLPTKGWYKPYRFSIKPGNTVVRESPWIEIRRMPEDTIVSPEYDMLCKTEYPAKVWINNDSVKQYRTGIFFGKVNFREGPNRIRTTALIKDSAKVFYEYEFIYKSIERTGKAFQLWIDKSSVEPDNDVELLPGDILRISFRASHGQDGFVEVNPGRIKIRCSRDDYSDYSLYRSEIPLRNITKGKPHKLVLILLPSSGNPVKMSYEYELPVTVTVAEENRFPFVKIIRENSRLTYNLGEPRLGGPIRSELGPGVILRTNGKIGGSYRIRLNMFENGFINENDVVEMPRETVHPSYYITNMSCGPSADSDVLTIPYSEPVPWEVYPEPDLKRITVTLFGVKTSSTWISHRTGRRIINNVTWKQINPETYQIYVNLKSSILWGYDIHPEGKSLVLRIKYPPVYSIESNNPLAGLRIAIEAGHGGSSIGAIGLSGLEEKEINLDLSLRLEELFESMGATVIQIRESDKDMSLTEKRDKAISEEADMLVSIHANAGGRGYLQVGGTSTYYHNPFWARLAESIYDRLLELGLDEFGIVGSFNYTVTRVSQMPSVLVEQAFMTHAGDEEKLADPVFRKEMAQKILEGILDYLRSLEKEKINRID